MIATGQWFCRKFELDLRLEMYPNVLSRLRGAPARLEDLFRGLPHNVLTRRHDDKWSMQEQAGHLLALEPLGMIRLDDFEAGRAELAAADLTNRGTFEANFNAHSTAVLLAQFRAERLAFLTRLEGYDQSIIQRVAIHPRLQIPMRVIDLVFFIAEHDDHHLARIAELRRMFLK